jgi:2-phospho-L-lactate guanylyltransferase
MKIFAVVPVSALEHGKSRLDGCISSLQRRMLNWNLFRRTMHIVTKLVPGPRCLVVSRSDEVLDYARELSCLALRESELLDLNNALTIAAGKSAELGADAVLSVSTDLPYLTLDELLTLVSHAPQHDVVIAHDTMRQGTNALLMRPPLAISYAYGEGSFHHHLSLARNVGLSALAFHSPGLARDLDTPEDLDQYRPVVESMLLGDFDPTVAVSPG